MKLVLHFFRRLADELRSIFISGFLTLLPIALTIALFSFTFKLIKAWSQPLYLILPESFKSIPSSGVLVALLTIVIVGMVLRYLLLHPLVEFIENTIFGNIPLVKQVYFGIKQLIKTLYPSNIDESEIQKVVLVQFPRPGVYCIGLVTGITHPHMLIGEYGQQTPPIYYNIFVPTTPNPTTGFFFMVAESECQATTLTRQEAMTLVISGGIIQPEHFIKKDV